MSDEQNHRGFQTFVAEGKGPTPRPLSPHLSIYRPMLTMMMSIVHRVTGAALYFGSLLLAWWLLATASGPNAYAKVQWFFGSFIGQIILLGFTWALLHHALGGIRHLIWDVGYGFGPNEREWLARATLFGSLVLSVILWLIAYVVLGGVR
jgi:succinate dehydrogenase / fumarate reductase cytochrome b subunit